MPLSQGLTASDLSKSLFMPAPADTLPNAFRIWIERYCGGYVPTCNAEDAAAIPPVMSKAQVRLCRKA